MGQRLWIERMKDTRNTNPVTFQFIRISFVLPRQSIARVEPPRPVFLYLVFSVMARMGFYHHNLRLVRKWGANEIGTNIVQGVQSSLKPLENPWIWKSHFQSPWECLIFVEFLLKNLAPGLALTIYSKKLFYYQWIRRNLFSWPTLFCLRTIHVMDFSLAD